MLWSHFAQLNYCRSVGLHGALAETYGHHVMLLTALPKPWLGRAERIGALARQLAEREGDRHAQAVVGVCAGYLAAFRGHWLEAYRIHLEVRAHARAAGDFLYDYFAALGLIEIDIRLGNMTRARQRLQELTADVKELARGDATARTDYYWAQLELAEGRVAHAERLARHAVETMRQLGDYQLVTRALGILAEILWELRRPDDALNAAKEVLRIVLERGLYVDWIHQSICSAGLVMCEVAATLPAASKKEWLRKTRIARNLALKRTKALPNFRPAALRLAAAVARLEGQTARARSLLEQARHKAECLGYLSEVANCLQSLADLLPEKDLQRLQLLRHARILFSALGLR